MGLQSAELDEPGGLFENALHVCQKQFSASITVAAF